MAGGQTVSVKIEVEARTQAANASMDKLAASTNRAKEASTGLAANTQALDVRLAKFDKAADSAATRLGKLNAAAGKNAQAMNALMQGARNASLGIGSVMESVGGLAMAFGPLGIAAAGGIAVFGKLVTSQMEAADAAREHTAELEKQRRELDDIARREAASKVVRRLQSDFDFDKARKAQLEADALAEELHEFDKQIAISRSMHVDTSKVELQRMRVVANAAATVEERTKLNREIEIRELSQVNDLEEKRTGHKRAQLKLVEDTIAASHRTNELSRLQGARVLAGKQREEPFDALDKQFVDARAAFEERRAKADEDRIKRTEEMRAAANEASRTRHLEEMERQKEIEARYQAVGSAAGSSMAALAQSAMLAGDLSAKGFKRVLAEWGKAESMRLAGVAISEGVQALVSLAFFNYPQAALHGAAAGAAAAGAAAIAGITGAAGGFGNPAKNVKSGFGGGGFSGGSMPAPDTPSSPSMMGKDQTPTSTQHAQSGSGGGGKGSSSGGVHIGNLYVTGSIDDATIVKIQQGWRRVERKLGSTGT